MELVEKQLQAAKCLAQDKYDEAIALYSECIEAEPNILSNYWELGIAMLLAGKELEAMSLWLQVMVEERGQMEALQDELIKVLSAAGLQGMQAGKYEQAEKIYWQIIEQNTNNIEAYKNFSNAVLNQGKLEEAIAGYQKVLTLDSDYDIAYYYIGYGFQKLGQLEAASSYYQQYLSLKPFDAGVCYNLGCVLQLQDKIEEAIATYQRSLNIEPNNYQVLNNLGAAFQKQGKLEEAKSCFQECINLKPNDSRGHFNLGRIFQTQCMAEEAIACYQQSLNINPNQPIICNDIGTIYHAQGNLSLAIFYYQEAFNLDSKYALAHYNLGVLLMDICELERAINCFDRAIEINPNYANAHWNRGLILLKWGDYRRGFAEYEWRWQREQTPLPPFTQPLWRGEELRCATILLYAEQGFGDTIQFIRYAPLVQQRGGRVVLECQQELVRLFKTVNGIDTLIGRETNLPEFDVHAPLMSLPYILGTTLETVPSQVPYLNSCLSENLKLEDNSLMKVGIVWFGNPDFPDNHKKSCSLQNFLGVLNTPGVGFYSLQKGIAVAEITQLSQPVQLQDLSNQLNDFADTAAVVAQLDVVISVDTAVAHLAAALGKPVWLLLAFNPDWRWMLAREDSPWYPTMRLFRQHQPGDWVEVFTRVEAALLEEIRLIKRTSI